jgi:hypothetical protein
VVFLGFISNNYLGFDLMVSPYFLYFALFGIIYCRDVINKECSFCKVQSNLPIRIYFRRNLIRIVEAF